eukprot:360807-Prymnesium_polylepis.1
MVRITTARHASSRLLTPRLASPHSYARTWGRAWRRPRAAAPSSSARSTALGVLSLHLHATR